VLIRIRKGDLFLSIFSRPSFYEIHPHPKITLRSRQKIFNKSKEFSIEMNGMLLVKAKWKFHNFFENKKKKLLAPDAAQMTQKGGREEKQLKDLSCFTTYVAKDKKRYEGRRIFHYLNPNFYGMLLLRNRKTKKGGKRSVKWNIIEWKNEKLFLMIH
jgi:hypothetical protein